jgi:hypothetical protein
VPLTTEDQRFLKGLYAKLQDRPLEPDDPLYQPVYQHEGCDDPIEELARRIQYADVESLSLFSGFRGSGKTTELYRLRRRLLDEGATVLYADALEYIDPATPVEIADLLITLAGAFSDALAAQAFDISSDSYWSRLRNWLTRTDVAAKELGLKAGAEGTGVDLKLEFRSTPTFRQKLSKHLQSRVGELRKEVETFFEDGVKAVRRQNGDDARIVFLFDSLEQIRGSLSNERDVTRSVEVLFSTHLKLLEIPYVHVLYTVPPWLKFVLPGTDIIVLPCLRLWEKDAPRSDCGAGIAAMHSLVERRFSAEGLRRFFGADASTRVGRLIGLCGGHFRDLLLLLRETVLRADALPVSETILDRAVIRVRSNFLPISVEDAKWLAEIERERATVLKSVEPEEINRLTRFLDTHIVLYLKNGDEWYDVHPLVRDEVKLIVSRADKAAETA